MEEGQLEASSFHPETWHSEVTVSVTGEPPGVVEEEETAKETDVDTIPEVIEPLSILDRLRISAVLEDTIDQLSILNYIMPVQYERRQSALMLESVGESGSCPSRGDHDDGAVSWSQDQRERATRWRCGDHSPSTSPPPVAQHCCGLRGTMALLLVLLSLVKKNNEINLEEKSLEKPSEVSKITSAFSPKEEPTLPEIRKRGQFANGFNKTQDFVLQKPTKQTITTTETLKKIQMDRQFLSDVITDTMQELQNSGTFTNLLKSLSEERENKMHFYDIIAREENGRKQIKYLQKQLLNVKRERQVEVQHQNEYIAHLKDQLQELKAKTNMENHYMKRNAELQVSQTQKKCNKTEELLLEEIEKLRLKTEEENQIHMAIEIFLRKEQQKLEEKLEFWMEKFDKDTEMKQNELNALKSAKASDLAHLQDLARMIREYEQVIIEDRIEKEKNRKDVEKAVLELKSIIKLQAWWRGTVIRNEIGSFSMPKRDKEDSKDSKGKDKDKRRGRK